MRGAALACLAALATGPAAAVHCERLDFDGRPYSVCEVDPATEDLRLFRADAEGTPYRDFGPLVGAHPEAELVFAMNAGMYHDDRSAVGLYVEEGEEEMYLVTNPGPGNFGLLPNGVFCIEGGRARVVETLRFEAEDPSCRFATQSGPMLVIDGELHPRFLPDSTSRHYRNGVGTTDSGDRAVFAISDRPVTFHEFGRFFRDGLGLSQALYFDGNVSRLHAPAIGRSDAGVAMGPIVGVLEAE